MTQVLSGNAAREGFAKQGAHVMASTPRSAVKSIADEIAKRRRVVRAAGIATEGQ